MPWRLNLQDTAWLQMDSAVNPMVITALIWLETPLDAPAFVQRIEARLLQRFPGFTHRIEAHRSFGRRPRWVPEARFCIEEHLTFTRLPAPGGRDELQAYVSDAVGTALDLHRSPWHLHVIDGVEGATAVLVRVHHAMCDGISLAQVLLGLTDPLDASHPPACGPASPRAPTVRRRLSGLLREGIRAIAKLLLAPFDRVPPLRGSLTRTKKAVWSPPIALESIKAIGRVRGATVNDVLTAAVAGGIDRYVRSRGSSVRTVHGFVPFNLRPPDGPLPARLGNHFGMVLLPLPIGGADVHSRIDAVKRTMDPLKRSLDPWVTFGLLCMLGALPAPLERLATAVLGRKASAIITNVPGPTEPVALVGSTVRGVLVWVPQSSSIALGVAIFSYAGSVTIGLSCDAHVIPDPAALLEGVLAELAEYAEQSHVHPDLDAHPPRIGPD